LRVQYINTLIASINVMNLTLKVKLAPTPEQFESLEQTMVLFNTACNAIADRAFELRTANKINLQKIVYYDVREQFKLPAQLAIRAIAKVCEVYKRDKSIKPEFASLGAIVYDQRILSWKGLDRASVVTVDGRAVIPIVMSAYHRSRLDRIRGQADLILQDGAFYLCVIVNVPEPEKIRPVGALGIDMGVVNIATDSDGSEHSGDAVRKVRKRALHLRAELQSARTKSARQHLKRLARYEARFQRDVNHCISKELVAKAKGTERAIAIEDLKGIRTQTTVRKAQRYYHSSWSFRQLRAFIEYKAALAGVPVIAVNPRGTSHICPRCGHEGRENRPTRDSFACSRCGFAGRADHVAAINIAARAAVNPPIVARDFLVHSVPLSYKLSISMDGS